MSVGVIIEKPWRETSDSALCGRPFVERKAKVRMHRKSRGALDTIICASLLVLLALALTARYAAITRASFEISKLDRELSSVRAENERLQIQIARLTSLERIEEIAMNRLGMEKPGEVRTLAYNPPAVDSRDVAQSSAKDMVAERLQDTGNRLDDGLLGGAVEWLIGIAYAQRSALATP
jgi:cell division protein FtsL